MFFFDNNYHNTNSVFLQAAHPNKEKTEKRVAQKGKNVYCYG